MIASVLTFLVAAIHLYILVLEMFLWTKPAGRKAFGLSEAFARDTRVLAANQGLYNGFLAVGLLYGLWQGSAGLGFTQFFLGCVIVAGVYGAATASKRILYIQALPAFLAMIATWVGI